jgi:CrcB protein
MIAVALAGGLGAAARLVVDGTISARVSGRMPWGTAVVNVAGSFLLGLVVALGPQGEAAIGTGFLGGFTTFSTASYETARLVLDRQPLAAIGTSLGMLLACVLAASLGFALGGL